MCSESEDEDVCDRAYNMPSVNQLRGNEQVRKDNVTYGVQMQWWPTKQRLIRT